MEKSIEKYIIYLAYLSDLDLLREAEEQLGLPPEHVRGLMRADLVDACVKRYSDLYLKQN